MYKAKQCRGCGGHVFFRRTVETRECTVRMDWVGNILGVPKDNHIVHVKIFTCEKCGREHSEKECTIKFHAHPTLYPNQEPAGWEIE